MNNICDLSTKTTYLTPIGLQKLDFPSCDIMHIFPKEKRRLLNKG